MALYDNIALVHQKVGEFNNAFLNVEHILKIRRNSFSSGHSHIDFIYNNLRSVYFSAADYVKAKSYFEDFLKEF